jgi:DNA adenine methylase
MKIPQPFPYQGSKRGIAFEILRFFPAQVDRLVEPFAGSSAISIAAALQLRITSFWLNDAHKPLINLWQEIIHHTKRLTENYEIHWNTQLGNERDYFNKVRLQFNESGRPADFLYLLARCVKAAIRYNSKGEFNNTPDHRRKGAHPIEMRNRLYQTAELLKGRTFLSALNYMELLDQCEQTDIVYMDPPYQGVCQNRDQRYCPHFNHDEFCDWISYLNRKKIRFIISYDGRTGKKIYGQELPKSLELTRVEIISGRSTQATLLGRNEETVESLYISKNLIKHAKRPADQQVRESTKAILQFTGS